MSIYKLTFLSILVLLAPFILEIGALFFIFTLQYRFDITLEIIPFGIGIFSLIILCIISNKIYNMRNALLAGLCMLSFLIGLFFLIN